MIRPILILLGSVCCLFWSVTVQAVNASIETTTDPIVDTELQSLGTEIRDGTGGVAIPVVRIKVNTVNGAAFQLDISSLKVSKLVLHDGTNYVGTPYREGDFTTYSMDMIAATQSQGTLGHIQPTLPGSSQFNTGSVSLTFNQNTPTANTVNYKYLLRTVLPINRALFTGTFKDTLTISVSDL